MPQRIVYFYSGIISKLLLVSGIFLYKTSVMKLFCCIGIHVVVFCLFGYPLAPTSWSLELWKLIFTMKINALFLAYVIGIIMVCFSFSTRAEDPYIYYTWTVTYGSISPLGVPQQGILINGQFPGPAIEAVTNNNVIVNVINKLDEPFLITWNGIQQRKTSWQDGVLGTNCPIPPNSNWTYKFQLKDQIGTYSYFPSTSLHRVSEGFEAFNIAQRSVISIPYATPMSEFTLLIGDWYKLDHKALRRRLDYGLNLPPPDGILVNGLSKSSTFAGEKGKTYKFRVSNVGIASNINFRIQSHKLKLIEVEGTHTLQQFYASLDIHPGQSATFLITLEAMPKDYFIVASSRFVRPYKTATGIIRYAGSKTPASLPLPAEPKGQLHWSMLQARTIRMALAANAARPNPKGHFDTEPSLSTFKDRPNSSPAVLGTSVVGAALHDFIETIFQNDEANIHSWHLDGSSFFTVGFGSGKWLSSMRKRCNLFDAVYRHTARVYPRSWSAILVPLDDKGMWNLRSAIWSRRYLGQELYIRVSNNEHSLYAEYDIPENAMLCGKANHP